MATTTAWTARGGTPIDRPGAFRAVERPAPVPMPTDLLVRVRAVSVNPVDVKVRAGLPAGEERQLGWDAAGTVEAVGDDVTGFQVGDEVWYAGDITRDGTNARSHAVDARLVARKPASLTWAEAAAMPLTAITAWEALFERMGLGARSTGTLLILGGAGGVGSVATQLAKALTGVAVVATASRTESREWAASLGADHVVDHRDLVVEVGRVAPDGVDWVLSPHTGGNVEAFAEIMAPFGTVVAIDDPEGLDVLPLKGKSIALAWELMFTRSIHRTPDMAEQGRILARVADLVDAGRLRTTATTRIEGLGPEGLRRAHAIVGSGRAVGKVVVHDGESEAQEGPAR